MQQTLRKFLRDFGLKLPTCILDGTLQRVMTNKAHTRLYFVVAFDTPIPHETLAKTEQELSTRIDRQTRILCRYPAETFSIDVLPDLFLTLKGDFPMINGFLDDAGLTYENGVLSILLRHGGADLLDQTHFRDELARAIHTIFGIVLKVEYGGDIHASEEAHAAMQNEVLDSLPEDRFFISDAEPEPKPTFTSITPDAEPLQPERPDKESLNVLYGRLVKEPPKPLSEIISALPSNGKVAAAVEVF